MNNRDRANFNRVARGQRPLSPREYVTPIIRDGEDENEHGERLRQARLLREQRDREWNNR